MNRDKLDWDWLDDLEYFVKIVTPICFILIGLFGHFLGVPEETKDKMLLSGTLGTGIAQRKK